MSGFEIAGLVLGIVPLLQEAFQVARTLKQRFEDVPLTFEKVRTIESRLNNISDHLRALQRQYGPCKLNIASENASIIDSDFKGVTSILSAVAKKLKHVFNRLDQLALSSSKRRKFFNLIVMNKRRETLTVCREVISQLDRASERLRHINQLLVTIATSQGVFAKQDDIIDMLQSLREESNNCPASEDTYKPSFFVPANPPIAEECLDYDAVDDEGKAVTFEGELKAELLRQVTKRQENRASLPIVGAVGMSGTGKSCALRGLGTEEDLKEMFRDGILFLLCGHGASNEDIIEELCSIVFQTGGRALSREMKKYRAQNAINDIIAKVSGWFKDKKCLFLVDDIWNTPATGSSLLAKLSTVVKNCDTRSGLVYTTKDERVDSFYTTVRFEWLQPYSSTCYHILFKAAGFPHETIENADQQQGVDSILKHCQGLKMALVVAGGGVKLCARRYGKHKAKAWHSYACALENFPHKLLTVSNGEYASLYRQFSVTLQTLSSIERENITFQMPYCIEEAFQALCVAAKGAVLYDSMLCRLWNLESIQHARVISQLFADVNLVETTFEVIDGSDFEGIFVHDLVHDYAGHLADQNYTNRNWIKGWEVWGLRLLESYFGADQSVVSSSSKFKQWWKESEGGRWSIQNHFIDIILRFADCSRIAGGETLSKHSLGVDRFGYMKDGDIEFGVCFILRRSTLVEMHDFVTTMSHERQVELSGLTIRLFIFTLLFHLRMIRLVMSCFSASEALNSFLHCLKADSSESPQEVEVPRHVDPAERFCLGSHVYVVPKDSGEYIQNAIELNWAFYDNCVEAPDKVDDERYHMLGLPLISGKMEAGAIEHFILHCNTVSSNDTGAGMKRFFLIALANDGGTPNPVGIRFVWTDYDHHFLLTLFEGTCVDFQLHGASDHLCSGFSLYAHIHDLGDAENKNKNLDLAALVGDALDNRIHKLPKIQQLCFARRADCQLPAEDWPLAEDWRVAGDYPSS